MLVDNKALGVDADQHFTLTQRARYFQFLGVFEHHGKLNRPESEESHPLASIRTGVLCQLKVRAIIQEKVTHTCARTFVFEQFRIAQTLLTRDPSKKHGELATLRVQLLLRTDCRHLLLEFTAKRWSIHSEVAPALVEWPCWYSPLHRKSLRHHHPAFPSA